MLKIRLSRTGKNTQPTFRLIVQEHTAPIKGKFVEEIGYYRPTTPEKPFNINSERVKHWISVGARPSDTVATLLKKQGFEGMEQYMEPRDKKRKSRAAAEGNEAEAPKQEKAEVKKEEPAPANKNAEPKATAATAPKEAKAEEAKTKEPAEAPKDAQQEPATAPEAAEARTEPEAPTVAEATATEAPQESPKS